MVKSVLVTGGLGYVGSRLIPLLLEKDYTVTTLDLGLRGDHCLNNLHSHPDWKEWEPRFLAIKGDIRDPFIVRQSMEKVDAIIHLAEIRPSKDTSYDEVLDRQVNFDAVGLILSEAQDAGIKKFINTSSSRVYGFKNDHEVSEVLEPEPQTPYARHKMQAEWLTRAAHSRNLCTVNIRAASDCGPSPLNRLDLPVNKMTSDAYYRGIIKVHHGEQRHPNVGITDLIHLYCWLLEGEHSKINGKTFNFGFENHRIIELAQIIKTHLNNPDIEIQVVDDSLKQDNHISSKKIIDELNYTPISSVAKEVTHLKATFEKSDLSMIDQIEAFSHVSLERRPEMYEGILRN